MSTYFCCFFPRLHKLNYEEDLLATIDAGVVIRDYGSICSVENMTMGFKSQVRNDVSLRVCLRKGGYWICFKLVTHVLVQVGTYLQCLRA